MTALDIKNALINDSIDFKAAFEKLKNLPKAWHTKEWATKRNEIIKNECEQCGNSDGVMIAQHLVHPLEFKIIRQEIIDSLWNNYLKSAALPKVTITKNDIEEFRQKNTIIREVCPQCKWNGFRRRKTMTPEYYCDTCKIGFDTPTKVEYNQILKTFLPNDDEIREYLSERKPKEMLWELKNKFYKENENVINKKALLIAIDSHLRYMSLENVVTFCKKCAAIMDLEVKLLCWNCKANYFNYAMYDACYKCYV